MDDELTSEELRLVELLRQEVSAAAQKRSFQTRQPFLKPAPHKAQPEPTAGIIDVAELRKRATTEFGEFKTRFSGLSDDDPAVLCQELEKLADQAGALRSTLETYLRHQKVEDARQAVSDMMSRGVVFQEIVMDDIHFIVGKSGEISLVSDPNRIRLSF
jgi:pentatricopeptide repeat protein